MANRFTSFIKSIFGGWSEDWATSDVSTSHGAYLGYWPQRFLPPDVHLTSDDALSISVVWACVDYISKSLAQCDWNVFQKDATGKRTIQPQDNVAWLLNQRPNSETTAMAMREGLVMQALVFGDGYWEIQRDNANRPFALHLLPSQLVKPIRTEAGEMAYEYRPDTTGNGIRVIPATNIFHLRGPSLLGYLGESIVTRAARSIAIAKFADEFALSFYANGTIIGGTLEVSKPNLTKDEKNAIMEQFSSEHKSAKKAHRPFIMGSGAKYTPLEIDAQKSQAVEARSFSVADICRFFGIPPTVIGHLDKASWNNVEHLAMVTVRDGLRPWAKRLEQEANFKLIGARSPRLTEINLTPLQLGDFKTRAEGYATMRRNGALTANEWRELEGMNGIGDEGDLMLVEKNMTLLEEEALLPAPPPAPAADPAADPAQDPAEPPEPGDGTEEPAEPGQEDGPDAAPVAAELAAHLRRVQARVADLKRAGKPPEAIAAALEKLAAKAEGTLQGLLPNHPPSAIKAAVESVAWVEPAKAAAHLLESHQ